METRQKELSSSEPIINRVDVTFRFGRRAIFLFSRDVVVSEFLFIVLFDRIVTVVLTSVSGCFGVFVEGRVILVARLRDGYEVRVDRRFGEADVAVLRSGVARR